MIEKIFAAPKYIEESDGLAFAVDNQTCYEIPAFMTPQMLDNKDKEIAKYKAKYKNINGILSLHGPIFDMNPVSLDPKIREASQLRYNQAIDVCKELGVNYLIFHSQFTPIYDVAKVYDDWMSQCVDYWQEVIETNVHGSDLVILMENFMDDRPDILNDMVSRINSPHFKACLDTGHVNLFCDVPPITWLDELGSNLHYIHAHNNNGDSDDHHAFNKGTIDMEGFLNHLVLRPNKVNLAIEVFDLEGVEQSFQAITPYMQMQEEHNTSKSFLI
ncbi:MAG: sugar phosphate isomerase/epimerase [Cyanobacteria bacterium]|nr:sugar phosphate isomerase/epimerase [Cyanobacteriota bacterium]